VDSFRTEVLGPGPLALEDFPQGRYDPAKIPDDAVGLQAFWLIEALRLQAPSRQQLHLGLLTWLKSGEVEKAWDLTRRLDNSGAPDREMAWAVQFQNVARGRQPPYDSMSEAREQIRQWTVLTAQVGEGEQRLTGSALWELRHAPAVELALEFAIQEIKLAVPRTSPVYLNALVSLGLTYESILTGDEAAYAQSWSTFIRDMETAQAIFEATNELLQW
jgi:hypothetical protein